MTSTSNLKKLELPRTRLNPNIPPDKIEKSVLLYKYYNDDDSEEDFDDVPWKSRKSFSKINNRPRIPSRPHHSINNQKKNKDKLKVKLKATSTAIKLPIWVRFLGRVALLWEALLCAILLWMSLLIVYNSIFSFQDKLFHTIINIIDIIFGCDMLIRLLVEVWRRQTKAQFLIFAVQYTLLQGILDMLSILPVDRFYLYIVGSYEFQLHELEIIDLLRLNRLLRTFRAKRFFDTLKLTLKLNEQIIYFLKLSYLYFIYAHVFVLIVALPCTVTYLDWSLYRASKIVDNQPESCFWTHRFSKAVFIDAEKTGEPPKSIQLYAYALEFIIVTFTTLGLGEIFPLGAAELAVMIFVMTLSVFLSGELSSNLIDFQIVHDSARFDLFYRVECIRNIYSRVRCPPNFLEKVQEFYVFLWNMREGVHDADLSRLPESLQQEIMLDISNEMFFKASFFRNLEEAFLRSLSRKVKINMYNPDMILCRERSPALFMYYVIQGELEISARCNEQHTAGILRPGCVVGEMNILFSFPYNVTIRTKTACQLLVLSKVDLLEQIELYPFSFDLLQKRFLARRLDLYNSYQLVGVKPVNYTKRIFENTAQDKERPVEIRRSNGLNRIEKRDIIDDSLHTYILSMPCPDEKYTKDPTVSYNTCQVIPIFTLKLPLLRAYNFLVILYVGMLALIVPYCAAFEDPNEEESYCEKMLSFQFLVYIFNIIDLAMEIIFASPASGIYFKISDGIKIKGRLVSFWFDVYAAIPFGLFLNRPWHWFAIVTQTGLKCFKITRYLSYCDNTQPFDLLLLRLVKFVVILLYEIHFTACFLFWISGNQLNKSNESTWLDSYYSIHNQNDYLRGAAIKERKPYLYPLFFASSIVTSVGHGAFHPQTVGEMFCLMALSITALVFVAYCNAGLTSALHCTVRPELNFNQKLVGIKIFMQHLGVGERLYYRIVEHYTLQNQLTQGVTLEEGQSSLLYDAPGYLRDDAIFYVTEIYLEGVPLFSKVSDDTTKKIARHMSTFLLPPGITFIQKGEVRRQLYIIARGSVGMFNEGIDGAPDELIITLTSTGHFGIRDLLFAESCIYKITTLSYVQLFAIDYLTFRDCFSHEVVLMTIINAELNNLNSEIHDISPALLVRQSNDKVRNVTSWIKFPKNRDEDMPHSTYDEFEEPYKTLIFPRLVRFLLMKRTLHPVGGFVEFWILFISVVAFFNLLVLFIETFIGYRAPGLRICQVILDILSWVDIYVRLHCAYYTNSNILITHPLRTSTHYVYEGLFFYDLCFTVPFELTMWIIGSTNILGYGIGAFWYTKLRWIRALQIYKFRQAFALLHSNFSNRMTLLGALYVFITLGTSALTGAVASFIGCPWYPGNWEEGDQYKLPLCPANSWARSNNEFLVNENFLNRFVLSMYFATQSVVLIGFGELIQPNDDDFLFLSVTVILGCFLIQFIIADLTSAQVDSNETRAIFEEKRQCVLSIFQRERLQSKWIKPMGDHLNYTWINSRGLQPAQLFRELHPALESELFREIVGDKLTKIIIFEDMHETVIRSLCELIRKEYFLRGERITRLGNLEYEMFIIVEGSVYITDRSLEWKCTLNEGEYFGEIGMLYGMARKYSAIAASNVAAFVLNSDDFAVLLDRYPSLREKIINLMKNDRKESYEKKITNIEFLMDNDESLRDRKDLHSREIKEHYRSRGLDTGLFELEEDLPTQTQVSTWTRIRKYCIGYGTHDRDLPIIYFASNRSRFKFLIHPECAYMKFHYLIVMFICYLSPAFALYEVIFVETSDAMIANNKGAALIVKYMGNALEIVMLWTIFLRFITPFQLPGGFFCKIHFKIVMYYISNPLLFLVDLITTIPYEFFSGTIFFNFTLLRFLRLIYFYRVLASRSENLEVSIFRFRLSISGSFLLLCGHINACLYYSLACDITTRVCAKDSWVEIYRENYLNHSGIDPKKIESLNIPALWYFRSFYWVVTIFTTMGYGDITPNNLREYILSIFSMVFGFFGLTIIVGNISTGLAALGRAQRQYFYSIRRLVNHLSSVGLSKERQELLKSYFLFLWQSGRGQNYHNAFSILPLSARFDASYIIYGTIIESCSFFGGLNDICFYRNISVLLNHAIFLPGSHIITQDEYGDNLFIIFKGRVGAYRRNQANELEYRKCYGVGNYFGRIPALFRDASYNKMYRAERTTEVLIFSQADILKLSKYYPRWKDFLLRMIFRKYSYLLEDLDHIFAREVPRKEEVDVEEEEVEYVEGNSEAYDTIAMATTTEDEDDIFEPKADPSMASNIEESNEVGQDDEYP